MKEVKISQAESEDNLHFLHRVDEYQHRRQLRRVEACKEIGISEARLSQIRNNKVRVSGKLWMRLIAAERRAGIAPSQQEPATTMEVMPLPKIVAEEVGSYGPSRADYARETLLKLGKSAPEAEDCLDYFKNFLETAIEGDQGRLWWLWLELFEHFPMDKWRNEQ